MTLCAPGGPKVIEKLGEIMGVAVEIPVKKKPVKKTVEKESSCSNWRPNFLQVLNL